MARRNTLVIAALLLVALSVGCASEAQPGDDQTTSPAEPPEAQPAVRVGFVNLEGGVVSVPELRIAAETAADYAAAHSAEEGTRSIEYVRCDVDGTPERSIDCANRMVEERVAVVQLGVDPSGDAMLPILQSAGISVVGHGAFGPAQQTAENAFFFGVASPAATVAPLRYFSDEGAARVRYISGDVPTAREFHDSALVPTADELGIDYDTVFYDLTSPDWNVLAATALADAPDVVGLPSATEPDCISFVGALRAAGFDGTIFAGACTAFVGVLGDQAEGVVTYTDIWRPLEGASAPAEKLEELDLYRKAMTDAGHEDNVGGYADFAFSDTMNLSRILASIDGDVTAATAMEQLRATTAFDSFMGPVITCDHTAWPGQSACGTSLLMYQVEAGEQVPITDDFITVDPPS